MKKLLDKDIREPLFIYMEVKYGKVRFFEEKNIGRSRADVMMVTEDAITGLEIKSDADSYTRLKRQIRDYDRYFDYNYVVIGRSHLKHVEEHIPEYWGIISCFEKDDDVCFEEVRPADRNPKRSMTNKMSFLWRRELNSIKDERLKHKYTRLSKAKLRAKIIEKVEEKDLDLLISKELFNRDYTIYQ